MKISSCSIVSLLLCLLLALPLHAQTNRNSSSRQGSSRSSQQKKEEKKKEEVTYPLYNGVSIGVDLWGLGNGLLGSDFVSSEVIGEVNLKNRYFPTLEVGFGGTDTWNEHGTHYKSSAPYFRIGGDYNMLYHKAHGHHLRLGLRYGMSSFKYDVQALGIDDPIYGGMVGNPTQDDEIWGGSLPFNYKGMKSTMSWAEFCVGLRANLSKSIQMGWSLRFKFKLSASPDEHGNPWYVPGFGKYGSNTIGITYNIIYKLPL